MILSRSLTRRRALGLMAGAAGGVPLLLSQKEAGGREPSTVYFYSPETNINNFSALKGEFDAYLGSRGGHQFQPFSDRATFERFMADGIRGVYLLSSWHFARLPHRATWEALHVGVVRNQSTQRHRLFGRKDLAGAAALRGATIATAGTQEFSRTLLGEMLESVEPGLVASFKLLGVPKEIDALMAVGFGMAQAAIATEGGATKLSRVNPKQHDALHAIAQGKDRLLPVIVVPPKADAGVRHLSEELSAMGLAEEGQGRLRLLGLDAFRKLEEAQKKELTTPP